jgi:hypothetical protein
MNHPVLKTLVTVVSATLLSAVAIAGDKDKHAAATFDSMDKNADQQISKTEAAADKKLADGFASMDSNGDGYLSKSEFSAKSHSDHMGKEKT